MPGRVTTARPVLRSMRNARPTARRSAYRTTSLSAALGTGALSRIRASAGPGPTSQKPPKAMTTPTSSNPEPLRTS